MNATEFIQKWPEARMKLKDLENPILHQIMEEYAVYKLTGIQGDHIRSNHKATIIKMCNALHIKCNLINPTKQEAVSFIDYLLKVKEENEAEFGTPWGQNVYSLSSLTEVEELTKELVNIRNWCKTKMESC